MRTCEFPDCGRSHAAHGLCAGHRKQQRQGKQLEPLGAWGRIECSFEGCDRPHRAQGWCDGHYQQVRDGRPVAPLRQVASHKGCRFPHCDRPRDSHGLCAGHRWQQKSGRPLTPIRPRRKVGEGRDPESVKRAVRRSSQRRRERESSVAGEASPQQIAWRVEMYGGRCAYCRGPYEELDHVIPVSRGGTGWPANLVPACSPCNNQKRARSVREWRPDWVPFGWTTEFTDPTVIYVVDTLPRLG